MTVAELIAELQKMPQDAGVLFDRDGDWSTVDSVSLETMLEGTYGGWMCKADALQAVRSGVVTFATPIETWPQAQMVLLT